MIIKTRVDSQTLYFAIVDYVDPLFLFYFFGEYAVPFPLLFFSKILLFFEIFLLFVGKFINYFLDSFMQ